MAVASQYVSVYNDRVNDTTKTVLPLVSAEGGRFDGSVGQSPDTADYFGIDILGGTRDGSGSIGNSGSLTVNYQFNGSLRVLIEFGAYTYSTLNATGVGLLGGTRLVSGSGSFTLSSSNWTGGSGDQAFVFKISSYPDFGAGQFTGNYTISFTDNTSTTGTGTGGTGTGGTGTGGTGTGGTGTGGTGTGTGTTGSYSDPEGSSTATAANLGTFSAFATTQASGELNTIYGRKTSSSGSTEIDPTKPIIEDQVDFFKFVLEKSGKVSLGVFGEFSNAILTGPAQGNIASALKQSVKSPTDIDLIAGTYYIEIIDSATSADGVAAVRIRPPKEVSDQYNITLSFTPASATLPSGPDFTSKAEGVSDATLLPGADVYVNGRVANDGAAAGAPGKIGYYLSKDATITTGDTFLGYIDQGSIGAKSSVGLSTQVSLPKNVTGSVYLGFIADYENKVAEVSDSNNASAGIAVTIDGSKIAATLLAHPNDTTGVAAAAYQFFLGSIPKADGFEYLISSDKNTADLNDPFYAQFNQENRYLNFAANLGLSGEGALKFKAAFGGLSFKETVTKAYDEIVGFDVAKAAGNDQAQVTDFFLKALTFYEAVATERVLPGQPGVTLAEAAKVVAIGSILNEAIKSGIGHYADGFEAFLDSLKGAAVPGYGDSLLMM